MSAYTDELVTEKLVPMRARVMDILVRKHPHLYRLINSFLTGQENYVGFRVTDGGNTVGEYTVFIDGIHIRRVEKGSLRSQITLPFGVIRPYGVIEQSSLEKMVGDERDFLAEPFRTSLKYLPDVTIKFLK